MALLPSSQLLTVWERGVSQAPLQRSWLLAQAAAPGVPVDELAAWPVGKIERQILRFRTELLGGSLQAVCHCPSCRQTLEFALSSENLLSEPAPIATEGEVDWRGERLRFRAPGLPEVLRCLHEGDRSRARAALIDTCVVEFTGEGRPSDHPDLTSALAAALAKLDPWACSRFTLTCPSCAHTWQAPFDVSVFVWTEFDAWARQLLREVHTLARHYGWSESEILALSHRRRRLYLELLAQ